MTPPSLTAPTFPRPTTQFNGKLQTTPDGKYIIGVSSITNNTATVVYQYEVDSGTILQSRTVTGQSSIMAMAPDGASFMAGFTLYGTANLNVIAQQNIANAPFPITGAFSTTTNLGGSVFTADGKTLYSAFNNSATTATAPPRCWFPIRNAGHFAGDQSAGKRAVENRDYAGRIASMGPVELRHDPSAAWESVHLPDPDAAIHHGVPGAGQLQSRRRAGHSQHQ